MAFHVHGRPINKIVFWKIAGNFFSKSVQLIKSQSFEKYPFKKDIMESGNFMIETGLQVFETKVSVFVIKTWFLCKINKLIIILF